MIKLLFTVLLALLIWSPAFVQEIPQGINYQAAARDSEGQTLADQAIMAEISLFLDSQAEPPVYREIQECTTNAYGIFNLTIGQGTPLNEGLSDNFSDIDWTAGTYLLKVRADFGSNEFISGLQDLGTYKLLSVPYAFSAEKALRADSLTGDLNIELEELANVNVSDPAHMQLIAWDSDSQTWILTDPGGLPDIFVRRDGSSDLSGDWTISDNSILLKNGNIVLENGKLTFSQIIGNSGISVSAFSDDPLLADSSTSKIPTQSAVKAYTDNFAASGAWAQNSDAVYLREEKKVGIGTSDPGHKFHLQLGNEEVFMVKGSFGGSLPDEGAGTRMAFYPGKAAFRAGRIQNFPDYWDNASVGSYSVALGYDIKASGDYSFAAGRENIAQGLYSSAFGRNNRAVNSYSFSAGGENNSDGLYSATLGQKNTASGTASVAAGNLTRARGDFSAAFGSDTQTGKDNGTMGEASFACGHATKAEGNYGFVSGNANTISADYSFSAGQGNYSSTSATASAIFGKDNTAEGSYSLFAGTNLSGKAYGEVIFGRYNADLGGSSGTWVSDDPLLVAGNGSDAVNRSNALVVLKNGNAGIAVGSSKPQYALQVGNNGDGTVAVANAWNTHSDRRLKTGFVRMDSVGQKLQALDVYYFRWKNQKDSGRHIGLTAQDLEKVFPELVSTGDDGYKAINYPVLSAVLIQAFNEQNRELEKIRQENREMKARLRKLEKQNAQILEYIRAEANIKMMKD